MNYYKITFVSVGQTKPTVVKFIKIITETFRRKAAQHRGQCEVLELSKLDSHKSLL